MQWAGNLTAQVRTLLEVTTARSPAGDLSRKITVEVKGMRFLELKKHDQHDGRPTECFAAEVTRVAREAVRKRQVGRPAQVAGVAGTWKDLTDNVNVDGTKPYEQVRGIVKVVTALPTATDAETYGQLPRAKCRARPKRQNNMTDTLRHLCGPGDTFALRSRVEGRLGGRPTSGRRRDVEESDRERELAGITSPTRYARSLSATAVTKGDLPRSISGGGQW